MVIAVKRNYLILAIAVLLFSSLAFSATQIALAQEEEYFFKATLFSSRDPKIAEALIPELAKIGIKLEVEIGDFGVWIDRAGKVPKSHDEGGFDCSFMSWMWGNDPDMYSTYHTKAARPYGWNIFEYYNGKNDVLLEQQRKEMDFTKRKDMILELLEIWDDDPPMVPIHYRVENAITSTNVEYYDPWHLRNMDWVGSTSRLRSSRIRC